MSNKSKGQPLEAGSLRKREWMRFLRGPDAVLLEELYVPLLSEAIRYDRCCAYFSSSVLSAAARGFARFIERLTALGEDAPRPAARLLVNEEMEIGDVRALVEKRDTSKLEKQLLKQLVKPRELLEKRRLEMLAWLVKEGLLEVKVGIMRRGEGIVHAKFGIGTDEAGDAVVFGGSGNESGSALCANYERIEVSASWQDAERFEVHKAEFKALWSDTDPDVHTLPLPEAVRLKLIKFAPRRIPIIEPSNAWQRQRAAMLWQFMVEAPYLPNGDRACDATALVDLWPHQRNVVQETAAAWPQGRLLCDEVGMGKTIEAILVLRRLMAGRGVRRILILLPAGLLQQWQGELREKGGLVFPRLEGTSTLVWPDERRENVETLAEALKQEVLLMSRESARKESQAAVLLRAEPWDLVLLDEAHAARRKEQKETEFNSPSLLLGLLRELQLQRRARGILLLSATPMQTHPWEPWDLLSVLGVGGAWMAGFGGVRDYYLGLAGLRNGELSTETARAVARLIAADAGFPAPPMEGLPVSDPEALAQKLPFLPTMKRDPVIEWLRHGSPLGRRMHRNTRKTLQRYHELGLPVQAPAERTVRDIEFEYQMTEEREVYNHISRYIDQRFAALARMGKGFVRTVYRRRASSSPRALEESLLRRQKLLEAVIRKQAYSSELDPKDWPEAFDADDLPEGEGRTDLLASVPKDPKVAGEELTEVQELLNELRKLGAQDSKLDVFYDVLKQIADDGRAVLVFTEYTDTMEYLRNRLRPFYGQELGCYSGKGGEVWDGREWSKVTKDAITKALEGGLLRVLLCTDAASEGLNLQTAGALINYDLPWNPSKVEQRIGRIDRIGQKYEEVKIVNLFFKNSIDQRVYEVLRTRCHLFRHFVGAMQPVLSRARRMLIDGECDLEALAQEADRVQADALAEESYLESEPEAPEEGVPPLTGYDLMEALRSLSPDFGFKVKTRGDQVTVLRPGIKSLAMSDSSSDLEADPKLLPVSPFEPRLREIAEKLTRAGERLPLVVGTYEEGAFRRSVVYWVEGGESVAIESVEALRERLQSWDGRLPEPSEWQKARALAAREARKQVDEMRLAARQREEEGLRQQAEAARLRLLPELGRYLVAMDGELSDLNGTFHKVMSRPDLEGGQRLRACFKLLGGYPDWSPELLEELADFAADLSDGQRSSLVSGTPLEAARSDPRWEARRS